VDRVRRARRISLLRHGGAADRETQRPHPPRRRTRTLAGGRRGRSRATAQAASATAMEGERKEQHGTSTRNEAAAGDRECRTARYTRAAVRVHVGASDTTGPSPRSPTTLGIGTGTLRSRDGAEYRTRRWRRPPR
jgi:hypothetical protein